jgi:hypothetical protein
VSRLGWRFGCFLFVLNGEYDALPVTASVSAFYMDVNLVSYSQWQTVYNWATNNGFGFDDPGAGTAANYPSIVGNAVLAGAFNATLNNSYVPTNGTTFNVLTYGSFRAASPASGSRRLSPGSPNYGSTNFSLVAGSELPQFGIVNLSGTNFIFNGTGGAAGSNYVILASTNLTLPLT